MRQVGYNNETRTDYLEACSKEIEPRLVGRGGGGVPSGKASWRR